MKTKYIEIRRQSQKQCSIYSHHTNNTQSKKHLQQAENNAIQEIRKKSWYHSSNKE